MIFTVKREGREWVVRDKLTKSTKAVRPTNSEAQRVAAQLERDQRCVGHEHVVAAGGHA